MLELPQVLTWLSPTNFWGSRRRNITTATTHRLAGDGTVTVCISSIKILIGPRAGRNLFHWSPATPNAPNDPVPIMPNAHVHPPATRAVEIGVALPPPDSRTPRTPAPPAPLAAAPVIVATCLRVTRCKADNADDQHDGCEKLHELSHRSISVATPTL